MPLVDKSCILQIIGGLMKHPQYLSEVDKYQLTPDDFYYRLDKYIFVAIDNLYRDGAEDIQPIDIENYLSTNDSAKTIFKQQNGLELLYDARELAAIQNFSYYYKKLKKFNLLMSLQNSGIDISQFYIDEAYTAEALQINAKFEELEIDDILQGIKQSLLKIERDFVQGDVTETISVLDGMEDILQGAIEHTDIGLPLQGDIFNEVCSGARKGTFVLRSASSGVGKTRQSVGDACYLAFPFRYEPALKKWVQNGSGQKVLVIATEQSHQEIQKMVLAYLTGMNETRFRYGGFTDEELHIIRQAMWVLNEYSNNLFIVRMPNPTVELIKTIVRENVVLHDIEYVFYDYIFICPSLLKEYKGFSLRNDKILSYI